MGTARSKVKGTAMALHFLQGGWYGTAIFAVHLQCHANALGLQGGWYGTAFFAVLVQCHANALQVHCN